ncbi:hypothetical protein [Pedobacter gandavensis]|uniref:Uncharacterized protein n=1 Tax=Pedobacter gandavensis TaxID=2679963 RepID=A0ABR6EPU8_9SPHI|nr:hypothetical protein [Pedobacter gandavensis]MBB2147289.1 hypothetical protein [Pedobacter gandavensis]
MKNQSTPKPGSVDYDAEKPQHLNIPKHHSSTDRRDCHELPGIENLNDQADENETNISQQDLPKTDLGNPRNKDEHQRERLITP